VEHQFLWDSNKRVGPSISICFGQRRLFIIGAKIWMVIEKYFFCCEMSLQDKLFFGADLGKKIYNCGEWMVYYNEKEDNQKNQKYRSNSL
jgi:hypothetical protein